jgi:hypothetical protein
MVRMNGITVNGITYFSVKIKGRETKGVRTFFNYMPSLRKAIIVKVEGQPV